MTDDLTKILDAAMMCSVTFVDEWQPIETAPKDGTEIFGYSIVHREFSVVWWQDGVWASGGTKDNPMLIYDDVSHWQPLPEPPAA